MTDLDSTPSSLPTPIGTPVGNLRGEISAWQAVALAAGCVVTVLLLWGFVTSGKTPEDRIVSRTRLPSPRETFAEFHSLWFEQAFTRNVGASLRRVSLGFALAAAVGVPLGILCGCFPHLSAFVAPISLFGRNIPMAALIPLTLLVFGIDEFQKVMFIFLASVAFIVSDTARAVRDVPQSYVDTAYTLGASRWQVIVKVLTPLALPNILDTLRLLFGLAFGYIMLAEVIKTGDDSGLGGMINTLQRRSRTEAIYLVLIFIPVIALLVDRLLYFLQVQLCPHRYGSDGLLAGALKPLFHGGESLKQTVFRPVTLDVIRPALPPPDNKPEP